LQSLFLTLTEPTIF